MSIAGYRDLPPFEDNVFSGHDEQRRYLQVDEPTSLLDGVYKGNPFTPNKRNARKPP